MKMKGHPPWNKGMTKKTHPDKITYGLFGKDNPSYGKKKTKMNSSKNNLISLCVSCHTTTNYHRKYWEWQLKVFMNLFHDACLPIDHKMGGSI